MGGATRFLLVVASPFSLILHRSSSSLYRRLSARLPLRPFSTSSTLSPHIRLRNFTLFLPIIDSSQRRLLHTQSNSIAPAPEADDHFYSNNHHPWPEWSNFLQTLSPTPDLHPDDSFLSYEFLSQDFLPSATSALAFARNRPDILGVLPRRDMVALVQNGTPFLFKSSLDTSRRMRAFLGIAGPNVLESDNAQTVDLMKYILSYVSNPSVPSENANYTLELIESSVRNLLSEFSKVIPVSHQHEVPSYSGHAPKPFGQNIEMKKGDWICPRCSFMNFARNVKCLECDEARPQRQLTGREWECPQCTFFNYGRNTACLRCDCKRPGEVSSGIVSSSSGLGYNRGDSANNRDISNRLAANEEKAQRWFNKVSQSNTSTDLTNAAADEDFPEIMPLRKGENRFVVSTRKSPLERRMANTQYQRNLGSEVSPKANDSQYGDANINLDTSLGRRLDQIITRTSTSSETDDGSITGQNTGIMRSNTPRSGFLQDGPSKGSNSGYVPFVPLPADKFAKKTESLNSEKVGAASSTSVPSESHDQRGTASVRNEFVKVERSQLSENPENEVQVQNKEKEQTTKSDGWFNRVAELHNDSDSTNGISEEDFPEIMPMRKGENKFVVSKKKDRSLTSPMYKRQMAMEQANKNTFVPFVPFPPDYFAKKNTPQPDSTTPAVNSSDEASGMSSSKSDDAGRVYTNLNQQASACNQQTGSAINAGAQSSGYQSQNPPGTHSIRNESWNTASEDQQIGSAIYSRAQTSGYKSQISPGTPAIRNETWNSAYSEDQQTESAVYSQAQTSGYQSQSSLGSHAIRNERWGTGPYREDQQTGSAVYSGAQTSSHQSRTSPGNANVSHTGEPNAGSATQNFSSSQYSGNSAGSTNPTPDSQKFKSEWTGKSLEGSAVKEIDPLDMSEEAKTERWFRRVAHIKDINELSQIPDEDFPSIMPMRKGVNRFVVSKRKTPLERRLTSPQYRRNLPVVSSDPFKKDPLKKEDDSN